MTRSSNHASPPPKISNHPAKVKKLQARKPESISSSAPWALGPGFRRDDGWMVAKAAIGGYRASKGCVVAATDITGQE